MAVYLIKDLKDTKDNLPERVVHYAEEELAKAKEVMKYLARKYGFIEERDMGYRGPHNEYIGFSTQQIQLTAVRGTLLEELVKVFSPKYCLIDDLDAPAGFRTETIDKLELN